jgi:chorismate mutase
MGPKEQFAMLRNLVALDVDIDALDRQRLTIYEARTALGRSVASAKARAEAIRVPDDLPEAEPDVQAITDRLTNASDHNRRVTEASAMFQRSQETVEKAEALVQEAESALERATAYASEMRKGHAEMSDKLLPLPNIVDANAVRAEMDAANQIIDGFRQRQAKINAEGELTTLTREQEEKTAAIAEIDAKKAAAITSAKMPVEGLSFHVPEGESFGAGTVLYKGHPLRQASGAEQLAVSAAIGAALNPKLRVLLCRDGSLLDSKSLAALSGFAEQNDMQVFLERVDESGEIGVVIEDGHVKGQEGLVEQFLKEEADTAAKGAAPETKTEAPDPERLARAKAYVETEVAKLVEYASAKECDKANATVKHMLRSFPDIFAAEWTPAYLDRVKILTKKK